MELLIGLQALLQATLRMATPLVYTAVGETYSERAGVINIGLEGLMLIGACTAYTVAFFTESLSLALVAAALITALFGLAFAFLTITIKANQIVIGAALNMVGLGVTGFVYRTVFAQTGLAGPITTLKAQPIPILSDIPFVGPILFNQNLLVYAIFLLVPLAAFGLNKSSLGLALRAVGEHPQAVDTAGLPVLGLRYGAVIFAALLAGIGGAYLPVAHANQFVEGMTAGRGFIALAMVVFGRWSPAGALWAGLFFGAAFALQLRLQATELNVAYQFLQILPYVATVVALVFFRGQAAQPRALGVPYEAGTR